MKAVQPSETLVNHLSFTKGQGTGNDFVLLRDPNGELELNAELVRQLSDRRFGIGADGVIRAVRSEHLPEGAAALAEEPTAEWFMDYWNADGSVAEMCGNGIRVFFKYLLEEQLLDFEPGSSVAIGTRAGVMDVTQTKLSVQVDLGRWNMVPGEVKVTADGLTGSRLALSIDLGNPHLVVILEHPEELEQLRLIDRPVLDPEPPAGANIEFVVPLDPAVKDGVGRIAMRVYERGVGETLSCGTGAVAAALAARHAAGPQSPAQWQVQVPGGTLGVRMFPTEEGEHVSLSGPAVLSFRGTIAQ